MWAPRRTPIATHHADYSAEESISSIITSLYRYERDVYHPTRVYKVTLIGLDDEVIELIDWLAEDGRKIRRSIHPSSDGTGKVRQQPVPKDSHIPIRHFALSSHKLTEKGYESLAQLVEDHGSLTILDLTMNNSIMPLPRLTKLPSAVSNSNLRKLILSSTPLYPDSFCHLIDNLRSPTLRELRLSLALPSSSITREESRKCALSIAHLVRPERPCSRSNHGKGDAPQLELLTLNGNPFTIKGIKMIVAAIVGSSYWPGNTSLTHVELFATCTADDVDSDDDEEQQRDQSASTSRRRTTSISRHYLETRRAELQRVAGAQGRVVPPIDTAATRQDRPSTPLTLARDAGSRANQVELTVPPLEDESPANRQLYAHINAFNWRHTLGSHLWSNTQNRSGVIYSALTLLGAARILGCKSTISTDNQESSSRMSLATLPPEIRLDILKQLIDERNLSQKQFDQVISFACDPRTLGYGSSDWTPAQQLRVTTSLLPSQPFTLPPIYKDYEAEAWDTYQSLSASSVLNQTSSPMATKHPLATDRGDGANASSPDGVGGTIIVNGGGEEGAGVWNPRKRGMPDAEMLAFLEVCACRSLDPWM
ncbi:unnamed protein product [Sympodiomycopsis kandeliae]